LSTEHLTDGLRRVLAVDIGGTKIAAAIINEAGEIEERLQASTNRDGPSAGIAQIAEISTRLLEKRGLALSDILAVGIGIPAVLEPATDRVIWAPNLPGWRHVALRESLQELIALPVFVEYDGHTAVLGEWWVGAGRGYDSCVDVIIGTGIGGGMILDGRLIRGNDRLAGAAGWIAMSSDDLSEGNTERRIGQWEKLAAGPGIATRAALRLPLYPESELAATTGELSARDVFDAARKGDPLARQIVDETADIIGVGVANIVSLINPQIVILGGSIGAQGDLLLPRVREAVQAVAQPISAQTVHIQSSTLATDAGLLGAAYAAISRREAGEV
jgi:glucokinase